MKFDRLVEGQAAHAQANVIFSTLESVAELVVIDRDLTAPPGGESDGDTYIVGASATGAWAGQDGKLAIYYNGGYLSNEDGDFPPPYEGMRAYIQDENVLLIYNGSDWDSIGVGLEMIESPAGQRIGMTPLPIDVSSPFLFINSTAYFNYIGKVTHHTTIKYVEAYVVIAGVGAQIAEVGLFSTASAPKRANQTLTKIAASGSVSSLTSTGMKRNITAFTEIIPAGTHLWAGMRTAMATTQPKTIGHLLDQQNGFLLQTTSAAALTTAGPWSGIVPALTTAVTGPALRVTMD